MHACSGHVARNPRVRRAQLTLQPKMPMTRTALAVLLLVPLAACMQAYEPPRADQPHAVIKLRRSYDTTAGTHLSEAVDADENYLLRETAYSAVAKAPLIDSFLAHPIPTVFTVYSDFHHSETRMVTESYQDPQTHYRTESYSCGFGNQARTCSRTVSDTRYTTRYRTVQKVVRVSDGGCSRQLDFTPRANHVYLLQYTYQAAGVCRLTCFEQIQGPDGTFQNLRCTHAPPAPK